MVSCRILKSCILLFVCFGCFLKGIVTEEDVIITSLQNVTLNTECKRDVEAILRGIQSREEWALQIIDSMEKIPSGILMGRFGALGYFEECLRVVHPNFTTKHCILEIGFEMEFPDINDFMGLFEKRVGNLPKFLHGVCIPSTCNGTDLQNGVEALGLKEIVTTEMKESSCTTKLSPELRTKDYVAIALFLFIIMLSLTSTAYDVYTSDRKTGQSEILKCFSLCSNAKSLFDLTGKSNEMDSLNGIRFFSFTWVLLGHLYVVVNRFGKATTNVLDMLKTTGAESHIIGTNGFLCVDTFFFLSGLLVCLVFFQNISRKGTFDAPVALIHRYFRLTPSLLALVLFNSTIQSRMLVGPFSQKYLPTFESDCVNHWWAYLLYLEGPFHNKSPCFAAVWYLCADMHMYMVSPLILYVLLLRPKIAPLCLGALTLTSTLIGFIWSYVDGLQPSLALQLIRDPSKMDSNEYYVFITRMSPWLVGIGTGYIICGIKAKKINFRPKMHWIVIGWLTAVFFCMSSLYGVAAFYPMVNGEAHTQMEYSSYRALHRLAWGLGLSWVVIACANNCGGVINAFLSHPVFKPLAKLSYCAFLNHLSVQIYRHLNGYKTPKYYTTFELVHTYLGYVVMSLALAVPMTLFIEMPFAQMGRILCRNLVIFPYPKPKVPEKTDNELPRKIEKQ